MLVPRERLVDALWGERPPGSAHASLQVYVHGLRRVLGRDRIATVGTGYRVYLEPGELDVERFEQFLARADSALEQDAPSAALEDMDSALALWRGPPLADLRDQPFASAAVPRLEELRLRALEIRVAALLALGEPEAVLPDLEQLIADHPYRERLREQQILALYRSGRQKEALDAYQAARSALVDELGVDPGSALQELERAVLRQDTKLVLEPRRRTRLPAPATPLIGRRLEIAAVAALLREEARLVTLTGPGGTGKTRLALAVAENTGEDAAFIDLSSATAPEDVLPAVAAALEIAGTDEEVSEYLADRSLLLVLDNLEQLGTGTAPVGTILAAAPRVRILATSRVPLRLSGEFEYPVPPLEVPVAAEERFEELVANDAVRLFAARARAADPSFALASENLGSVVAICRRLDGLPLALELAATWIKVLGPHEIERRLMRALDLLVQGARDLPARQQTLRATLDWSYELLGRQERRLLAELSVFAGGFTLDDAEAVAGGDVVAGLGSLVDHSLVQARGGRFAMLETIREYGHERLDEPAEPRRRHGERFGVIAQRARAAMLDGGDAEAAAFALIDAELENLRAALEWAHEASETELEGRIAVALRWYWLVRGRFAEGTRIFERLAEASRGLPATHADALSGAAVFNYRRGDRERAKQQLEAARRLYARLGNDDEDARCIAELGAIAVDEGDLSLAAKLFGDVVEVFERIGSDYRLGVALSNLAAIEVDRGNLEEAAGLSSRAIELQRSLADLTGLGVSLANLGRVELKVDGAEAARASLQEALEIALKLDYKMLIAYLLGTAGDLAAIHGDADGAARLVGAGAGLFASIGMEIPPEEVEAQERVLVRVRASLGAARVEELLAQGREAPLDSMVEAARAVM